MPKVEPISSVLKALISNHPYRPNKPLNRLKQRHAGSPSVQGCQEFLGHSKMKKADQQGRP